MAKLVERFEIDDERLDAAQREYERHERQRKVTLLILQSCAREMRRLAAGPFSPKVDDLKSVAETLDGVLEVMRGEWLESPKAMAERKR